MNYKWFIFSLEQRWIGKKVIYDHQVYTVVGIDYNGFLLIDKKTKYSDSYISENTAVSVLDIVEV